MKLSFKNSYKACKIFTFNFCLLGSEISHKLSTTADQHNFRLCVTVCMCLCVFLHDTSKRNRSRNTHTHTHTHTHRERDSDKYSIDAFCKNATIITEIF